MTKIVLDGREIEVDPRQPLIRACHDHGVDVPMYCYHPGLKPVGSCRICQVEVKQGDMPTRVTVACRTPVAEGMIVSTTAPKAREARRECLEFLLENHPLDCPICDKAGECDLQDYSFNEGQGEGRSSEPRRKLAKRHSLGDVIVLDQERCILCSRCVRFFEDVTKKPQLTVAGLGSRSVIATFQDRPLQGNYQGNLADICPVGALTLKAFRFQARVWNLTKTVSTCAECSRGCRITVEVLRSGAVKRFRPRFDPQVNQWWMCDRGRFAFEHVARPSAGSAVLGGRLDGAAVRGFSGLERCSVADARAAAMDALVARPRRALLLSSFCTQEEAQAALELARALGAATAFLAPPQGDPDELLHTGDPCPNRAGLSRLGVQPMAAGELGPWLRDRDVALFVGERVLELAASARAELPGGLRLIVCDAELLDWPNLEVGFGVPLSVEKHGTWINVGGLERRLAPARASLSGVGPLERLLADLLADWNIAARRGRAPQTGVVA
jgi:NADH-quinone oxidoreductase subunit G